MKYAIIAAGEGSRLAAEGIAEPKPLVQVGGECLIDRLIRIFMQHDADEIVCICNDRTARVASHLARLQRDGLEGRPVPLRFVVKSTPSSMHSFFEISHYLQDGPFIMTTVDTIFRESDFTRYVDAFSRCRREMLMGVTEYIEDESPLYVSTDERMNVTAFEDAAPVVTPFIAPARRPLYVSAGIYGLQPAATFTVANCVARSETRMRNFQRALLAEGHTVRAWAFGPVFDVDHASDVQRAADFLRQQ